MTGQVGYASNDIHNCIEPLSKTIRDLAGPCRDISHHYVKIPMCAKRLDTIMNI